MLDRRSARNLLSLTAVAASIGCATAPEWRMDDERRAAIDRVLDEAVESGRIPGVVALVTTADAIVYRCARGSLDPETGAAMTPDAIFDVASMTKPITSVGVMMLVEEGRIGLDDPASRHLPELAGRAVLVRVDPSSGELETRPPMREPTIRDLLRHTSGIGYSFCSPELRDVERFAKVPDREQPLLHDPGARWTYGMGTAQLGWIIENVAGVPLAEFLRERVLAPLEMPDTSFGLPPEKAARMVTLHRRRNGVLVASPRREPFVDGGRGDGDLLSTADDYAHFMQMILGHGRRDGVRLLDAATVAEMTRDQLDGLVVVEQPETMPSLAAPFPLGAGRDGFGLGFQVAVDGADGRPDGTLSWSGLYNTHFWIDPATGIGVVLLVQILPFYDPAAIDVLRQLERAVYDRPIPGEAMELHDMRSFARAYTAAWCGRDPARVASFFAEDGSLTINEGAPAVGRAAIADAARGFMEAFPDLIVRMDALERSGDGFVYHWTLTGTNTGPGGTGRRVEISGHEAWTMGADGLVARSFGRFDEAEYARQLGTDAAADGR